MNTRTRLIAAGVIAVGAALHASPVEATAGEPSVVHVLHDAPTRGDVEVATTGGAHLSLSFAEVTTVAVPAGEGLTLSDGKSTVDVRSQASRCGTLAVLTDEVTNTTPGWVTHPLCDPRLPEESGGVRFYLGTLDTGPVHSDPQGELLSPHQLSQRLTTPAGSVTIRLQRPGDDRPFLTPVVEVGAGDIALVALLGGGEFPLRAIAVRTGHQPPQPPAPDVPIETGNTDPPTDTAYVWLFAAGVGIAAAACRRWRRSRRLLAGALLVLFAVTLACGTGTGGGVAPPSAPPTTSSAGPASTDTSQPERATPPARDSPVRVVAAGLDARIVAAPSDSAPTLHRTLRDPDVVWFTGTDTPGHPGVTVLAGHGTWRSAPGVFAPLVGLHAGDHVTITTASGRASTYTVTAIETLPKGALTDELVAPRALPTLHLITCTGPIDPATGRHADNLIVTATITDPQSPAHLPLDP